MLVKAEGSGRQYFPRAIEKFNRYLYLLRVVLYRREGPDLPVNLPAG
jgi:hypothetical protein